MPWNSKERWKKVPLEDRRKSMERLTQIRKDRAAARKLAEAIDLVKSAGYKISPSRKAS